MILNGNSMNKIIATMSQICSFKLLFSRSDLTAQRRLTVKERISLKYLLFLPSYFFILILYYDPLFVEQRDIAKMFRFVQCFVHYHFSVESSQKRYAREINRSLPRFLQRNKLSQGNYSYFSFLFERRGTLVTMVR